MGNRIIIFVIALSIISCSDSDTIRKELPSGMKEVYQVQKKSGEKSGIYRLYYPDGNLFEESDYRQGKLNGQRILYYPSGKKEILESYQNDTITGTYQMFHENGSLKLKGAYKNGVMTGIWKAFYESGALKEEVAFSDNLENGPFIEYYKDGTLKAKGNYINGENEDGILFLYDSSGDVSRVMMCDSGICRTQWTPDSTFAMPSK